MGRQLYCSQYCISGTSVLYNIVEDDDGTYTAALRNGTWKFMWGSPGDNNDWYATDGSVTEGTDDDGTGTRARIVNFFVNV